MPAGGSSPGSIQAGGGAAGCQPRPALRFAFGVNLQSGEIQWIEAHFDALAGQMRGRFEEVILQQEGGIAAHHPVYAMKEQTA